jgi:antitoxin MazE
MATSRSAGVTELGLQVACCESQATGCFYWCLDIDPMAMPLSANQVVRRWGNSLGVRLPAAIVREVHLLDDQPVQLTVAEEGILIRPARQRPTLAERLARYQPMEGDVAEAMAWDPIGAEVVE